MSNSETLLFQSAGMGENKRNIAIYKPGSTNKELSGKQKLWSNLISLILVFVFNILFLNTNAETYFVSNAGDDANPGTSESMAWRTLTKINSFSFSPGDQILFKRGNEWLGGIMLASSGTSDNPIVYSAYGSGEKPIIRGDRKIIGWIQHQGSIFKANISNPVNQLFCNGTTMQMSRYPENGYLSISSIGSNTTYFCDDLSGTDWTGASAILRFVPWGFEGKKITASTGNSITIENAPVYSYALESGDLFFVINSLAILDGSGQWVYEESSNAIYFWPPEGTLPDDESVSVSMDAYGFQGAGVSNITIQDFTIKGFQKDGILLAGICSNISVVNTDIINNYECGVHCYDDESSCNLVISDNLISGSNRDGIRLKGVNCTITNNSIGNISLMANIGTNAFVDAYNTACGMTLYPVSESLISHNTLDNIGYNGIMFYGTNNTVEFNRINKACMTLQDGGGIYSHLDATGSFIQKNIISKSGPDGDGGSLGIYMDASSIGMTIVDNTVFECNGQGLFLSNSRNMLATGNTFFDNQGSEFIARHHVEEIPMFNNIVTDNVFFAKRADENQKSMMLACDEGLELGLITGNNIHGCPDENSIYYIKPPQYWTFMTLAEYQQVSGSGQGSTRAIVPEYENVALFYNDTTIEKSFDLNGNIYRDLNGNIVNSLILQAFTSKILVAE